MRSPRAARAGRVPVWLTLGLVGALALALVEAAGRDARAKGFARVDTRRAHLTAPEGRWIDPRWQDWLAARVAEHRPPASRDDAAVDALVDEVAALPFVAEVGLAEVLWPDGLAIDVRLRVPAACVRVGRDFLPVATDGTVLPGSWPSPPWVGGGFLPVIGPNDRAGDALRPGDRLSEPRHVDALAVALSLRAAAHALGPEEHERMGPPVIDATRGRAAGPEEGGVQLLLEGRRAVLFGRSPNLRAPGELPATHKWESLGRALRLLEEPGRDWSVVDVRWDRPEIRWRPGDEARDAAGEGDGG